MAVITRGSAASLTRRRFMTTAASAIAAVGGDRIAQSSTYLADFIRRVLRISAAIVEKETNVMCLENLDQPFVLRALLVNRSELVTAGSERGTWRVFERGDRGFGFNAGVD